MRKGSGGSNRLVRYFLIKLPVFSLACSLEEGGTVHLLLDSGSGDIAKSKNGSPLPEREAGSFFWDVLGDASLCEPLRLKEWTGGYQTYKNIAGR